MTPRPAIIGKVATSPLIFRKGLDMKEAVAGELAAAYDSAIVDEVRANDYRFTAGRLTMHLAQEFGFCYGVDRAVDYAYQARRRFPGRNVFLTGEIIHNPHVNERLRDSGIRFLSDPGERRETLGADDVVILPAFGVTVERDGAADGTGLHARRHHVRVGAERLEERHPLRAGRLHRHHPRQGEARGNPGDGLAGAEVSATAATSSCSIAKKPRSSATTSGTAGIARRFSRDLRGAARPASIPTPIWSASDAPIRRRC